LEPPMVMDHYPYKKQTLVRNPGAFSDVYDSPLGARFWKFLTQPENVLLLEGATFLRQPAIVVLAPRLLAEFDRELRDGDAGKGADRLKQALGTMVRDIMVSLDYEIERSGVNVQRFGPPFVTATRYLPPGSAKG